MSDPKPGDVPAFDPQMLVDLARMEMPFGRYQGRRLIDLPEPYVVWFRKRGFPRGRLGLLLGLLYEIKANGLEHLVRPLAGHGGHPGPRSGAGAAPNGSHGADSTGGPSSRGGARARKRDR